MQSIPVKDSYEKLLSRTTRLVESGQRLLMALAVRATHDSWNDVGRGVMAEEQDFQDRLKEFLQFKIKEE